MRALRRLTLSAVAVVAAAALLPAAQPPPGGPAPAPPPKALAAVPREGYFMVSVNVAQLWDDPALKVAQDWFSAQKEPTTESMVGVAPAELERVTVYVPAPGHDRGTDPIVLVTTRQPYNEARVVKNLLGPRDAGQGAERAGNVVVLRNNRLFRSAVLADNRTLLLLPDGNTAAAQVAAQLISGKTDGALAPAVAAAGTASVSVGLDPRHVYRLLGRDAPGRDEFAPFAAVFKATSATFTADLAAGGVKSRLSLMFAAADDARRAGPVLEEGLADLARLMDAELKRQAERGDHGALPAAILTIGRDALRAAKVEVKDTTVVATADGPDADALGKLIAALPKQVAVTRRHLEAQNNLKQILLGLHNFHDTMSFMPGDVGMDRKTAWSWRVQLLPHIEHGALYNQLDHQKSWDDPRNKAILEKAEMPKVYEVPGRPAEKGHTYWRSFTLPKKKLPVAVARPWLVEGEPGPRMASITDGLSNTIAVVEAGEAVPWYAPDVLAYDGKMPLPQLGAKGGEGFLAGMGDGTVRFVRASTPEAALRASITRDGGEVITLPER
ncbi:MAG TPA: DUF1559 domain-containing protein [Urbifossiella sp.]|nr:DUF1559 domain-containing protein [Urbifossiella sp.]